jgi:hypothetical protein
LPGAGNIVGAISAEIRYRRERTIRERINSGRAESPCAVTEGDHHGVDGAENYIRPTISIHISDGYAAILW